MEVEEEERGERGRESARPVAAVLLPAAGGLRVEVAREGRRAGRGRRRERRGVHLHGRGCRSAGSARVLAPLPRRSRCGCAASRELSRTIFFCQKYILPPPTITKVWFFSYNYKTGYFTSLNFSNRAFYLPRAVLKTVCYSNRSFVFFFF